VGQRLIVPVLLELLGGDRPPDVVDQIDGNPSADLFDGELEVLGPEPLPRLPGKGRVVAEHVDLGVVEEGVLVEVRRPERQPLVVDDADLGVDIDGLGVLGLALGVDRAGQEAPGAVVGIDQLSRLTARDIGSVVGADR
jgi:hypothetical protein